MSPNTISSRADRPARTSYLQVPCDLPDRAGCPECLMPTTAEYRRFAETCLRWAYRAKPQPSTERNRLRCRWAREASTTAAERACRGAGRRLRYIVRSIDLQATLWQFASIGAQEGTASLMTKSQNRCASCGGKLGLVCHHYWRLRFCCKACKTSFLRKQPSGLALYRSGRERR
jgi:hypothetical protein